MAQLSFSDVENLWIANGGDSGWAPLAAGLAWAESGFQTDIRVKDNDDDSVGLWMINYIGSMMGPRTARYGSPEAMQADPNLQAKAAIDLFGNGAGVSNWMGSDGQGDAGQKTYLAWRAAGFPQKPSSSQVKGWLANMGATAEQLTAGSSGSTGEGSGAVDENGNPAPSDYTLPGGNSFTAAGGRGSGCNAGSKGISFGGVDIPVIGNLGKVDTGIGNACQLKALTGGLMIGLGGALLITGAILIVAAVASSTRAGKAAAGVVGTVAGGPIGGIAASAVTGGGRSRSARASVAPAGDAIDDATVDLMEASAKEQTRQRRENPSAKQKQFESNRRAARLALRPGEKAF